MYLLWELMDEKKAFLATAKASLLAFNVSPIEGGSIPEYPSSILLSEIVEKSYTVK